MTCRKKLSFIKITHIAPNKENKIIVIKRTQSKVEMEMMINKNVFVIKIYLILNGFSVAMKINVEDRVGIISNVVGLIEKICKISNKLILYASFVKEKIFKIKVLVILEKELRKNKVANDLINL
jgi:hypothetical protein